MIVVRFIARAIIVLAMLSVYVGAVAITYGMEGWLGAGTFIGLTVLVLAFVVADDDSPSSYDL